MYSRRPGHMQAVQTCLAATCVVPRMECAECAVPEGDLWAYPCGHFYYECCVRTFLRDSARCPACHDPSTVLATVLAAKPVFCVEART